MPVNPDCHVCHGDPEVSMICSICAWDQDMAFLQIARLQSQVRFLMAKTGFKYEAPEIEGRLRSYDLPDGAFPNLNLADDIAIKTFTLEEAIDQIDGRSLQRIFREVEDHVLVCVLLALPTKELVQKMRKNISRNHFDRLIDDIKCGYGRAGSTEAIEKFLKVIHMLEEMGEIVGEIVVVKDSGEYVTPTPLTPEEQALRKAARDQRWQAYREQQRKADEIRAVAIKDWLDKMEIK